MLKKVDKIAEFCYKTIAFLLLTFKLFFYASD